MQTLAELIRTHEDWLVERALTYGRSRGYARCTSTLAEAWRASIAGLSAAIMGALAESPEPQELSPEEDLAHAPVAAFSITEAERHRARGVTLTMFLGLIKYYRQSYLDLLAESAITADCAARDRLRLERIFDRIEIGCAAAWTSYREPDLLAELQAANARITQEKDRFLAIFESLPDPVLVLDPARQVAHLNSEAARLLGLERLPGGYYYGAGLPHTELPWLVNELAAFLSGDQEAMTFEKELPCCGSRHCYEVRLARLLDIATDFRGVVVLLNDITERQRAEDALRSSEERFRVLAENASDVIWTMDLTGRFTYVSPAVTRLRGFTPEEVLQQSLEEAVAPQSLPAVLAGLEQARRALAGEAPGPVKYRQEVAQPRKDGSLTWTEVNVSLLTDAAGQITGLLGITRDIAERRAAEAKIRFQAGLLGAVGQAIVAIDPAGCILYWNHMAEQFLGWSADDATGRKVLDLVSLAHTGYDEVEIRERVRRDQIWTGELELIGRSGARLPGLVTISPLRDEQGNLAALIAVVTDLTERKRNEAAMLQAQKLESIGLMAGGIAHDFNNLLMALLGQIALARSCVPAGNPGRNHLARAVTVAERATDLTRQLLAYAGQGEFRTEIIDLNELIAENLALLTTSLPKNAQFELDLWPEPLVISADRGQVQQVIMNLALNAAEALVDTQGQVVLATSLQEVSATPGPGEYIVAAVSRPGVYACVQVTDTGRGMTPETVARIFDPFFTTKTKGRGLGLATVSGIIRGQKGGLQVRSRPGRGSTFTVYLPLGENLSPSPFPTRGGARGEVGVGALSEGRGVLPSPCRGGDGGEVPLVLIIDDEDPVRDALTDILELHGFRTETAAHGMAGIALYRQLRREVSVVLLDLLMPGIDGMETCQHLRELDPEVKVLMSSGYDEVETLRRSRGLPPSTLPTAFLQKPYNTETLVAKLTALMT